MTETRRYANQLEKKLIGEFKQKFQEKIGYTPIVLTTVNNEIAEGLPLLSLDELQECFTPFLPKRHGKVLKLGSKARYRELVELRNIYCAIARMMRYTLTHVGESLGGRDHTTVLHNVETFKNLVVIDEAFKQKYIQILNHIKEQGYEPSVVDEPDQVQHQPQPAVLP